MLQKLPGVRHAVVDTRTDIATVTYDPEAVTLDAMIEAVGKAGYAASIAHQ